MNDYAALIKARWAECHRRLSAAGIAPAQWAFHDARVMQQVLADEATGAWQPFASVEAPDPAVTQSSAAPLAPAPVHAPAAVPLAPEARARSVWSKAVTEANAEAFAQGDPMPADPQAEAETQHTPPAGSAARSRAAWGTAVQAANAELLRRGGRIGEA